MANAVQLADNSGNSISASNPLPIVDAGSSSNGAGTSRSGTIATGGTAQALATANTGRRFIKGQNISSGDLWVNELGGTAAADTVDSFVVPPRATFRIDTTQAVSIVGATTGQKFTALEV